MLQHMKWKKMCSGVRWLAHKYA